MSWSPNFEENVCLSNGLRPTFEQYDQQENYGLTTLRPKNVTLDVDEDVYDSDVSMLRTDVRADLELESYRRKFGVTRKKTERKQWDEQRDDTDDGDVEYEISKVMRTAGLEPEPPLNYRPNSKTTSKAAISIDKLPVAGVKNLYLDSDHFKFENPYVRTKPNPTIKNADKSAEAKINNSSSVGTTYRKSYDEPRIGVAGEKYVTPAQLYVMKARRNR